MNFSEELKAQRGSLRQKEYAAKLDIPLPSYRKYENGKRTPNKLAMAELRRRMETYILSSDRRGEITWAQS